MFVYKTLLVSLKYTFYVNDFLPVKNNIRKITSNIAPSSNIFNHSSTSNVLEIILKKNQPCSVRRVMILVWGPSRWLIGWLLNHQERSQRAHHGTSESWNRKKMLLQMAGLYHGMWNPILTRCWWADWMDGMVSLLPVSDGRHFAWGWMIAWVGGGKDKCSCIRRDRTRCCSKCETVARNWFVN